MRERPSTNLKSRIASTLLHWGLVAITVLFAANVFAANGVMRFETKRIKGNELVDLLARGESRTLKSGANLLMVRLHSLAFEGDCVDGTHYVCYRDYYLTVQQREEGGASALFYLGRFGELAKIEPIPTSSAFEAEFAVNVANYPNYVSKGRLIRRARLIVRWHDGSDAFASFEKTVVPSQKTRSTGSTPAP